MFEKYSAFIGLRIESFNWLIQTIFGKSYSQKMKPNDESINTSGLGMSSIFQGGENLFNEKPFDKFFEVKEKIRFSSQKVYKLVE